MHTITLDSVLDEVMLLSSEQRDMLVDILRGRQIELHREQMLRDVEEGLAEFKSGNLKPMTVQEIMKEAREPDECE